MDSFRSIIAVPGRLESSRLPNKLIKDIGGKNMIQRVLERCKNSNGPKDVILCTDSDKLKEIANSIGFKVLMTPKECSSGSDRISRIKDELIKIAWSDYSKTFTKEDIKNKASQTLIINVQGDQPFIDPLIIDKMHCFFSKNFSSLKVVTPVYKLKQEKIHKPENVKVLLDRNKRAIYFSRAALPFIRDVDPNEWAKFSDYWGHVGIYGVRADIFFNWKNLPESLLEKSEKLEQLRFIDSGIPINTFEVDSETMSIDTYEQLDEARKIISNFSNHIIS